MSEYNMTLAEQIVAGGGGGSDDIWLPSVDAAGDLSWRKSSTDTPPETVNIKGAPGADGQDGAPGQDGADGLGVKSVDINGSNHLIVTYDDDTTEDAGAIDVTVPIDDTTPAANKVYSSNKVEGIASAKLSNVYKGKKVVHMGDSWIHSFGLAEASAEVLGYTVTNCGFTGTSISDFYEALSNARYFSLIRLARAIRDNTWTDQDTYAGETWGGQLSNLKNVNWGETDVLILSYGVNDLNAQNPTGDIKARDDLSVCGALKAAINIFQTINENMEIICTTPCYRVENADNAAYTSLNERVLYDDYINAIGMTCKELSIKCIDMRALSGINSYNMSVCLLSDGLHPTTLGKEKWVNGFTDALQSGFYGTIDTSEYHRIENNNLIFDSEKFTRHKQWNATYVHTNGKKYLCTARSQRYGWTVLGKVHFDSIPSGTVISLKGYGLKIESTAHRIGFCIRNADNTSNLLDKYTTPFSTSDAAISYSFTTTEAYSDCWVLFYINQMSTWDEGKALVRDMKCTVTLPST